MMCYDGIIIFISKVLVLQYKNFISIIKLTNVVNRLASIKYFNQYLFELK